MTSRTRERGDNQGGARMTGPGGVNASLGALTQAERELAGLVESRAVRTQNAAAEIGGTGAGREVPGGERLLRKDRERAAGEIPDASPGTAQMAIEMRHSQDRLEGIAGSTGAYVDAVMQMLNGEPGRLGRRDVLRRRIRSLVRTGEAGREEFHAGGQGHFRDRSEQELVWLHIFHPMRTGSTRRWRARTERWKRSRPPTGFRRSSSGSGSRWRRERDATRRAAGRSRGMPAGVRRRTNFDLQTYLTSWDKTCGGAGLRSAVPGGAGRRAAAIRGRHRGVGDDRGTAGIRQRLTDWRPGRR